MINMRMVIPALFSLLLSGATPFSPNTDHPRREAPPLQQKSVDPAGIPLRQSLLDLSSDYVLMDVSAHPDDEDGSTLALYRMKYGVKTYSVLFTRGEGGQNEKGSELYEELGVLRTEETRAAGRILGAEVRFLNFPDFGYSKSATEAFEKWGGQMEALRRLVYVIRRYKPDVLFSNHNTVGGHGHHQAVALTALAAFDAASDSTMFPEQLREEGESLWQPKKLFFRVFGRTESSADVSNPIEDVDSLRGVAYIDIASEALRKHQTQGMDRANLRAFTRGRSMYRLVRSNSVYDQDSSSFFSGIDLWQEPSLQSLHPLKEEIERVSALRNRDSLVARGARLLEKLASSSMHSTYPTPLAGRILAHWRTNLAEICRASSSTQLIVTFADSLLVPGQKVECQVQLSADRWLKKEPQFRWSSPHGWQAESSGAPRRAGNGWEQQFEISVPKDPEFTYPRAKYIYAPLALHSDLTLTASVFADGTPFSFSQDELVDVAPPHVLTVDPPALWVSPEKAYEGIRFAYSIRNCQPHPTAGHITARVPAGWEADVAEFAIHDEDSVAVGTLLVRSPRGASAGTYHLTFTGAEQSADVLLTVAEIKRVAGLKVGLVASYDNTLENALRQIDISFTSLTDEQLANSDLSLYNTILLDIRAYLVRDALKAHNKRLLDYVSSGGNLVVMYQRQTEWKPEYAPYPFELSRDRVTREDAPVQQLQSNHPLLTWPNRIGPQDWQGWKQERTVYMPADVPSNYIRLLSTQDPDEAPRNTGYLVAAFGKGSYIYTSYVWYRQLKEGNVGALRCFTNMISYPLRSR